MADQKDMGAISRIAVADELGRNKIVHKAFEGRKQFCEFGFHEFRCAFCVNLEERPPCSFRATPRS
ncbi:hypothetical protein [Bradyrhizobium sp.]|uniref:hypothetical protein n=1 Tax=Bradyrhizobium sp. TaxID=376 RepID=UPI003BB20877